MTPLTTLRIGTRASKLARWQAEWVAERLRSLGHDVAIVEITTHGDTDQSGPIGDIGSPGVFTKEIQRALLAGEVDVAVHSLKDLPTDVVPGISLAAVPPRKSASDVLVSRVAKSFDELPLAPRLAQAVCADRPNCVTPVLICESKAFAATSTPACENSTRANSTQSFLPKPAWNDSV